MTEKPSAFNAAAQQVADPWNTSVGAMSNYNDVGVNMDFLKTGTSVTDWSGYDGAGLSSDLSVATPYTNMYQGTGDVQFDFTKPIGGLAANSISTELDLFEQSPSLGNTSPDIKLSDTPPPGTDWGLDSTMGWFNENSKGINSAMGLAGMGMDAYSTFFGQGKELFDKKSKVLDQQIEANEGTLANNKAVKSAWTKHGAGVA